MKPDLQRDLRGAARAVVWVSCLGAVMGCGAHALPEIHSDAERLEVAKRLNQEGQHAAAIELLQSYIASAGGAADVDQALYLLGYSRLASKEWALAAADFERLLRDYPESDSAASASFRLGEAQFGQARRPDFDQEFTAKALAQWESYLRANPGHWLNPDAQRRILEGRTRLARKLLNTGRLYLKLREWGPARVYFERIVQEFPDTPVVPDARFGLAMADARAGRRAEAIAQLREIEALYPGTSAAEHAARERKSLERKS